MPTQTMTVNGLTFEISITDQGQTQAQGPSTPSYTLDAPGAHITTGAAEGVAIGTISTSLPNATVGLTRYGGLAATVSGLALNAGIRAADIMYRRSLALELQATAAESGGNPGVTLTRALNVPIVEAGGPTLTLTPSKTGALSVTEFNAPMTTFDDGSGSPVVVTASGGTGPYRFNVITDNSPFEVAALNDTQATLYATGWLDSAVQSAYTFRIRAQDSTGAYAYLDVNVNVTAFDLSQIPGLIRIDPANATSSGGNVSALNAVQGTTNYAMTVPAGSTQPTIANVNCPDGTPKPAITVSDTTKAALGAGPGFAGSSAALGPLFSQSNIRAPKYTIIGVLEPTSAAQFDYLAAYHSTEGGGWHPGINQGVFLNTNPSGQRGAGFGTDGQAYYGQAISPATGTGWQLMTGFGDGVSAYVEPDNPEFYPYTGAVSPDFGSTGANQASDPSPQLETASFTADSVQIGGGSAPSGAFSFMFFALAPTYLTQHQRQQIYAYLARHYPVTWTPPVRKVTSGMQQTFGATPALPGTFENFMWGDLWFWEFDTNRFGAAVAMLNPSLEAATYINDHFPGVTGTYPDKSAFFDASKGALQLRAQPSTAAQIAYTNQAGANYGTGYGVDVTTYTWRGSGVRTVLSFAQHLGYFEAKVKNPRGKGLWPCSWTYPDTGGSFELDFGESNCQLPSFSSCTLHSEDIGSQGGPSAAQETAVGISPIQSGCGVRCDDLTTNWTAWGVDWYDNGDGTHTIQFYRNREPVGYPIIDAASACNRAVSLLLDVTMESLTGGSNSGPLGSSYTTSDAPHFYQVEYFRAYAYVDQDRAQPPLPLTKPTLAGTRGSGDITATPGTFDWAGTSDYKWFTFDWTNGEVELKSGGNSINSVTLTTADDPDYATKTLVFEHGETGTEWGHRIRTRAFKDPTTTPDLNLRDSSTLATTTALPAATAGQRLAYISPAVLGADVSITASDASGFFAVSADGRELLAGPNYGSVPASTTVYLTQTPRFGGPVNNQTIAVTTAGTGSSGATWAATTDWTLTNSNLTANLANGGSDHLIRATNSEPATGAYDYSFTVHVDALPSGAPLTVGVADTANGLANPGTNNHSCGVNANGDVVYATYTTGGNVGRALQVGDNVTVRMKNGNVYFQLNGGAWVGTGASADPTTDTGGVSISGFTSAASPAVFANYAGTQVTGTF